MKKPRPDKQPVQRVDDWYCECTKDKAMTREECKAHLETVHGLKELKVCMAKMILHLDAQDHFVSNYEVEIGGVKLVRCTVTPRKGFDGRYLNPR